MTQCPNCSHQNRDGARFCALCRTELFPSVIGGDYRVLSVIDSGGMGRVYKAERQGQLVAVKEVKDSFKDARTRQDAINRFMAEALTLARLKHPNIPVIHRNFVENGRYYGTGQVRWDDSLSFLELNNRMPHISPSLAALVVGVGNNVVINSLTKLRYYLLNQPSPARAQITYQHVDFGSIEWEATSSRSIRLSSLTQGLMYGEIAHTTEGLSVRRESFGGFHPCHWDIEIDLDTKRLPKPGQSPGQITIVTPVETFQVTTQSNVIPRRKPSKE